MELQEYKFVISPENVKSDLVFVTYTGNTDITTIIDPCCLTATTISATTTGSTGVYLPMSYLLSGNTGGTSFLTGLSVNIMLTESTVDLGYYSPTDGMVLQKDVLNNFDINNPIATVPSKSNIAILNKRIEWKPLPGSPNRFLYLHRLI